MDARSPKALKMLAAEIERQLKAGSGPSFTPQHLTMLTHSLAILGLEHGDPAALELLSEVQGRVAEFNARDITNTTSALAMMGGGSRRQEFLRHLGDQAVAKLDDFNSQELLKVRSALPSPSL